MMSYFKGVLQLYKGPFQCSWNMIRQHIMAQSLLTNKFLIIKNDGLYQSSNWVNFVACHLSTI